MSAKGPGGVCGKGKPMIRAVVNKIFRKKIEKSILFPARMNTYEF